MTDTNSNCPFCRLPRERVIHEATLAFGIRDAFPVSPGHTLIIPRRHISSYSDTTRAEHDEIFDLLVIAKAALDDEFKPDGYNIGINDGRAAGQTVPHLHVHLIPRYNGDREDPRGGVRWVLPDKAAYWNQS